MSALRRHIAEAITCELKHERRASGSTRVRINVPDLYEGKGESQNPSMMDSGK